MNELQLWQSIASLSGAVEGLNVEIREPTQYEKNAGYSWIVHVFSDDEDGYSDQATNLYQGAAVRNCALLIVDAIEATGLGYFERRWSGLDQKWQWEFWGHPNTRCPVKQVASNTQEHLSLLTVIERVMRAIKEAQNG